jgi:hypothetical protein
MLDLQDLDFTGSFSLVERGWAGVVGQMPGVYVLRSLREGGAPVPVPRAGGVDERGVLDISETGRRSPSSERRRRRVISPVPGHGRVR